LPQPILVMKDPARLRELRPLDPRLHRHRPQQLPVRPPQPMLLTQQPIHIIGQRTIQPFHEVSERPMLRPLPTRHPQRLPARHPSIVPPPPTPRTTPPPPSRGRPFAKLG